MNFLYFVDESIITENLNGMPKVKEAEIKLISKPGVPYFLGKITFFQRKTTLKMSAD